MSLYTNIIINALLVFPIIALVITLPYILYNYRRYGSIFSLRIAIVYSFVLYLICAYFLVILPLPTIEEVAQLTTPRVQLIPFSFVQDISVTTSLIWDNFSSYLHFLSAPAVYQMLFNILLVMPFGMYLRYYFKCSLKKTILLSFALSLFFELTQLSGLYFIYPRSYRLFDVDDLIINTLGGCLGYALMTPFMKILPTRQEIDEHSYQRGLHVSLLRRFTSLSIDYFFIILLDIILRTLLTKANLVIPYQLIILVFLYFMILPLIWKGKTLGKSFTKIRVVHSDEKNAKWYQYLLRYGTLYLIILLIPKLLWEFINMEFNQNALSLNIYFILCGVLFAILISYLFIASIEIATHKILFYERLSKTKIISTIQLVTSDSEVSQPIKEEGFTPKSEEETEVISTEETKENEESI